jgi:hypothetical protein
MGKFTVLAYMGMILTRTVSKKQDHYPKCYHIMSKKHQTMPNEPEEMPDQQKKPEIEQPGDPKIPEVPQESPDEIPEEIPPEKK